jgi:hypothetical protein
MREYWRLAVVAPITLLTLSGCGETQPKVYPVTAVVRMDGERFGPCALLLTPLTTSGPKARSSTGNVAADGMVTFTTFKVGDGVPAGDYKVTVRSELSGAPPKPIPSDYQSDAKTPLRATVNPSDMNELAFDLESKGGKGDGKANAMQEAFQNPGFSAGAGSGAE